MTVFRLTSFTWAVVLAVGLTGCTTTQTGTKPVNPTADQQAIYGYTDRYVWQGALTGAAFGCLSGMLTASDDLKGCLIGASAGAIAGAAAGTYIKSRQDKAAGQEVALRDQLDALDTEVKRAQSTAAAARRQVQRHRVQLASLQQKTEADADSKVALQQKVDAMQYDLSQLKRAEAALEQNILEVDEQLKEVPPQSSDYDKLADHKADLEAARSDLDESIDALAGLVTDGQADLRA